MKKKTVFIVLGCVAVVATAIVALVFYVTSGMTAAADEFFKQARAGDLNRVYVLTSAEFRNATSRDQLESFIEANRFDQVAETSWSSRSIENNLGKLEGSLTLDDGGVIPVVLQVVSERGDWKVSFIELRDAGLSGGADPDTSRKAVTATAGLPPDNVILNTVRFHTGLVFDAAQREDGLGLQSSLEYLQQFCVDDVTIAQLEQLVEPMRKQKAGVEKLSQARPVVERASPNEGGGFLVQGYLEAVPWRYDYTYSFVPDGEEWKLAAVDYDLSEYE